VYTARVNELPTFDQFIEPLFRFLAEQAEPVRVSVVHEALSSRMGLSSEQQTILLPSRGQPVYKNRIGWAHDRLKREGLSDSPRRGYWQLTDEGRAFHRQYPKEIPRDRLAQIAFRPSRYRLGEDAVDPLSDEEGSPIENDARTPEERAREAFAEIRARVRQELLDTIREMSPTFFERLVLDLLHAMGYGGTREDLQETPASGDGGIDGIISLDRLGLEKVYIQAKRYAEDHVVGRPAVQGFFGALAGRRANKGVFITTSSFSREARDFAAQASDGIVLVSGTRLADLMIDHGVGVARKETFVMVDIDNDYFDE
jgi:restriction system protein